MNESVLEQRVGLLDRSNALQLELFHKAILEYAVLALNPAFGLR